MNTVKQTFFQYRSYRLPTSCHMIDVKFFLLVSWYVRHARHYCIQWYRMCKHVLIDSSVPPRACMCSFDAYWGFCKTKNFRARLIFVNFINSAKFRKSVFTKGFFIDVLIDGRPQSTNVRIYDQGKIAIFATRTHARTHTHAHARTHARTQFNQKLSEVKKRDGVVTVIP